MFFSPLNGGYWDFKRKKKCHWEDLHIKWWKRGIHPNKCVNNMEMPKTNKKRKKNIWLFQNFILPLQRNVKVLICLNFGQRIQNFSLKMINVLKQDSSKQLNKTKDVNTEFTWKTHQRSRLWKRREKDYSNRHLKNENVNKLLIINILNQEKVSVGGKGSELFYSDNYKERKIMNIKFQQL